MTTNELICMCGKLGDLSFPARYENDDGGDALQDEVVQKLLFCCNCVLQELYCNYGTDIAVEHVEAIDNKIDVSNFNLSKVLKLKDFDGHNVSYRFSSGSLFVEHNGKFVLTYSKLPDTVNWKEEIVLPSPQITPLTYAYGVLSYYFLIMGDGLMYQHWHSYYTDALQKACEKSSARNMPVGRWC